MIPGDQNEADKVRGIQGESKPSADTNSNRGDGFSSGFFGIEPIGSSGKDWEGGISIESRSGHSNLLKKILSQLLTEHKNQIAMKLAEVERLEASANEFAQMIADIDAVTDGLSEKK